MDKKDPLLSPAQTQDASLKSAADRAAERIRQRNEANEASERRVLEIEVGLVRAKLQLVFDAKVVKLGESCDEKKFDILVEIKPDGYRMYNCIVDGQVTSIEYAKAVYSSLEKAVSGLQGVHDFDFKVTRDEWRAQIRFALKAHNPQPEISGCIFA